MQRIICTMLLGLALLAGGLAATAQRANTEPTPSPVLAGNSDPVQYAQRAYHQAAHILKSALPLYGGHDLKAMEFARKAEKLTEDFARERMGDARFAVVSGPAQPRRRKSDRAMAPVLPLPEAEPAYTAQQLKVSNARLQFSLSIIKTANTRLELLQGVQSISLSEAILCGQMSVAELDKALYVSRTIK